MSRTNDKQPYSGGSRMEPVSHRDPHTGETRMQRHRVGSDRQTDKGRVDVAGHHDQLLGLAALGGSGRAPVQVDTELAELYREEIELAAKLESTASSLHSMAGDEKETARTASGHPTRRWKMTLDEVLEKGPRNSYMRSQWEPFVQRLHDGQVRLDEIAAERQTRDAEFDAAGGWPRFFLVQNTGGHIHSSMNCTTCYPTTQYAWLPELSGQTEAEAVENYGGILCSVCYPSAPSDWTEGVSKVEAAEKEARAAAKRERDAAKLAKALMPDGQPLRLPDSRDVLKTQRAAEIWLSDSYDDFYGRNDERHADDRELVLAALEEKTGKTRDELLAETNKRVQARRKREGRA